MSEVKVNKISPRTNCGTVQLGDSGDTITIPSGATITNNGTAAGFGATGAASWDTTVKTASFTGVAGVGYFVNTTSGAITVTLPASPDAGAVIAISDYANTADTNNITLARNGSNIEGTAEDFVINQEGVAITFVYVDATKGWITTDTGQSSDATGDTFIIATGGTVTCCGDYKIHTFTGPGTFTVCSISNGPTNNTVDYMVVAGGGGGGFDRGGGGGAGGFRESHCSSNSGCYTASPLATPTGITVTAQAYPITVGGGGSTNSPPSTSPADSGSNSVFSTITSTGGGGGQAGNQTPLGLPGGSGGGGSGSSGCQGANAGSGNTPPVSPAQGTDGGPGFDTCRTAGGGGGGAGNAGAAAVAGCGAGDGGVGVTTSITATATKYAGGGGGGNTPSGPQGGGDEGIGGINPGGSRCSPQPDRFGAGSGGGAVCSTAGLANTGGGGGGGGGAAPYQGNSGGSGIVVIRYKYK
jgi:hypothetical protein